MTAGRLGLRRALGLALCLVAAWLLAAGLLGSTLPVAVTTVSAAPGDPTPTATPIPTATPSPTPTAAPTAVPTPYAESIDPDQLTPSIPATSANTTVAPHPNGSASPLVELALLGIVVFAVIAGTSFFLFFRIR